MTRLLMFLQQHAIGDGVHAFSRVDLGEPLGISTETSSRIIADLKRQGLIEERGGYFIYTDAEGIAALGGETNLRLGAKRVRNALPNRSGTAIRCCRTS